MRYIMDERTYRAQLIEALKNNPEYKPGAHTSYQTDCSGISRKIFRLSFNSQEFYDRLYIYKSGSIGAAFCYNDSHILHMAQEVGWGVYLSMEEDGPVLCDIHYLEGQFDNVEVRYVYSYWLENNTDNTTS